MSINGEWRMLLYSNPELVPRERSGFAELTAGVFWKPGEMIAMLWGYFDESGEHDPSGELLALTIGGLIAPLDAWQAFDQEWDAALAARGLREFHRRQFRAEGIDEFLKIIARRVGLALSFSAAARGSTSDAYERGLIDCLVQVANASKAEKVSLMFAMHPEFPVEHIQRYFQIVNWGGGGAQLSRLMFGDPRDTPPLQAADLVAHALRSDVGTTRRLQELGCKVFRFRDGWPVS
jgi:hypothetical protein